MSRIRAGTVERPSLCFTFLLEPSGFLLRCIDELSCVSLEEDTIDLQELRDVLLDRFLGPSEPRSRLVSRELCWLSLPEGLYQIEARRELRWTQRRFGVPVKRARVVSLRPVSGEIPVPGRASVRGLDLPDLDVSSALFRFHEHVMSLRLRR